MNNKSSIYISIFKRKGGEGLKTKIINDKNKKQYGSLFFGLENNETPLIVFFENMQNWFLLTDLRILFCNEGVNLYVKNSDIIEVQPAIQEEFRDKIIDKEKFTRLKLKTRDNEFFTCKIEQGLPYNGLYQTLHFIMINNVQSIK